MYGWAGKILYIDLTNKTYYTEDTSLYKEFIGGRGVNQYLLFKNTEKNTHPLLPESVIILGAGLFVGTPVPGACRLSVDFKNVITGGVGSSNCGGQFPAEMKFAGYDHIVIYGKSPHLVYLYIYNDRIYFRDASLLKGKSTWETENVIKELEGDDSLKTLAAGPAGENLVKFSCLIGDKGRAAGYGGSGAVFGSKNLKAVAVRGTLPVKTAFPQDLKDKIEVLNNTLENSEHVKIHREGGTLQAYLQQGDKRPHGVRNMSDDYWSSEAISRVTRDKFDRYLKYRETCFNCPVYCSGVYEIDGLWCEGIQANTLRAFGSNLDLRSPEVILHANALSNLYGLDIDQTSAVIAWAMECFENGIIDERDTGGIKLNWGNGESIINLIEDITRRRGFGDILAGGVYEASKITGRGSEKYTALVKKNSVMEAAMRVARGWALGVVTSTKGTGHLRGAPAVEMKRVPPEKSRELFGIGDISEPGSYEGKGQLAAWMEAYKAVVDITGICALITMWMDTDLFVPADMADLYSLVSGEEKTPGELLMTGEKIQNMERCFNLLHAGFDRKDDYPPARFTDIPVSSGPFKGQKIDPAEWEKMLDEYYLFHGWDKQSGVPDRERLEELSLNEIIEILLNYGVIN